MKNMKLLLIIFILGMSSSLWSAFDNNYQGNARALGMGSAYVANCQDESAVFLNSGGLAFLPTPNFGFTGSSLYTGLNFGALLLGRVSLVSPIGNIGVFGVGVNQFSAQIDESVKYGETMYSLSYGRKINSSIGLGISLNVPRWYSDLAGDTSFGSKSFNVSVDAGIMIVKEGGFRFGASVYSLNQPIIGVDNKEQLPLSARFGMSYVLPKSDFIVNSDVFYASDRVDFSIGSEYKLSALRLRAGILLLGITDGATLTAGAGYVLKLGSNDLHIDYAFVYSMTGVGGTLGSHFVSTSYAFGRVVSVEKVSEPVIEENKSVDVEPEVIEEVESVEGESVNTNTGE